MSAFDTMPGDDLERRLSTWMSEQGPDADLTSTYDTIVDATRGSSQRPWFLVRRGIRRTTPPSELSFAARRVATVVVIVLLAVAVVAGLVVGGSLLRNSPVLRPLPGLFTPVGPLPAIDGGDLVDPAIVELQDGRVLVAGGTNHGVQGWAWIYDPATGTYGDSVPMRALRQGASATLLPDGRVLIAGGRPYRHDPPVSTAEVFDPETETFSETGSMAVAREHHAATLLSDRHVLITGGIGTVGVLDNGLDGGAATAVSSELYDPVTGQFSQLAAMPVGRAGHTATLLPDGRVLIAGGYGLDGSSCAMRPTIDVFDPAKATFTTIGALETPRAWHSATLLPNGVVLVAGGSDGPRQTSDCPDVPSVLGSAELIDPVTGTSSSTGSLITERTGHAATLLHDGRVLVSGGTNRFGAPRAAELFDPASSTFVAAATAENEHLFGVAPLLGDGRVLLAGSGEGSELFDPSRAIVAADVPTPGQSTVSGPFHAVSALEQRTGHTAIRLRDGRVLVAGGVGGADNVVIASAEVFNPNTGTFAATGSMAGPRSGNNGSVGFVSTLLEDGRVLVMGGSPGEESGEIFDPAKGTFTPAPQYAAALAAGAPYPVVGLAEGTIILAAYPDDTERTVTVLDANSAQAGAGGTLCGASDEEGDFEGAAAIRGGLILFLCGAQRPAVIFDAATGAVAPTGLRGDWRRALPLLDGRVALFSPVREPQATTDPVVAFVPSAIYDPATGVVDAISSTQVTPGGTFATLSDGRILGVGGAESAPAKAASVLDVATPVPRSVGSLLVSRQEPTVTVLEDGRALVVGGAVTSPDRTVPIPPGAELFDPNAIR